MIPVKNYFKRQKFCKFCHCWKTQRTEYSIHQTQIFHQSQLGRDVELQNTHIVWFKSPRDVLQINILCQQQGLGSQLNGHRIIDLTPKTGDLLRYCSNSGSVPTEFYLPAGTETKFLNNKYTISYYFSQNIKNFH